MKYKINKIKLGLEIEAIKNNKKKAVILEVMENNSVYDYRIFIDGEGKIRKVKESNLFSE